MPAKGTTKLSQEQIAALVSRHLEGGEQVDAIVRDLEKQHRAVHGRTKYPGPSRPTIYNWIKAAKTAKTNRGTAAAVSGVTAESVEPGDSSPRETIEQLRKEVAALKAKLYDYITKYGALP